MHTHRQTHTRARTDTMHTQSHTYTLTHATVGEGRQKVSQNVQKIHIFYSESESETETARARARVRTLFAKFTPTLAARAAESEREKNLHTNS